MSIKPSLVKPSCIIVLQNQSPGSDVEDQQKIADVHTIHLCAVEAIQKTLGLL
jgi:hypothetical protein